MPTYTFNFNAAYQTLDHMYNVNKQIVADLEQLASTAGAKLEEWQGVGWENYKVAKARWDAAVVTMSQALDAGGKTLDSISVGYGDAEKYATNIWSSTHPSL
jgi:uncharacterized protein YukE